MVESFDGPVILPGEESWFVDGDSVHMYAAAAVGRDACVFAAGLNGDNHALYESYSRFYRYDTGRWLCVEIDESITSMIRHREPDWAQDGLAILSTQGSVWFIGNQYRFERIDDVATDKFGYLNSINCVERALYALGTDGQIYRRRKASWIHEDKGILKFTPPLLRPRPSDHDGAASLYSLTSATNSDSYACGVLYTARPALFWKRSGQHWQWLGLNEADPNLDQVRLNSIFAESSDVIWIATNKGYLLRGNGSEGFKVVTNTFRSGGAGRPATFRQFAAFQGSLYIGGSQVCRIKDNNELEPQFGPPAPDMESPKILDTAIRGTLDVVDGVMWAITAGVLSRFNGMSWERVIMPSVYRN